MESFIQGLRKKLAKTLSDNPNMRRMAKEVQDLGEEIKTQSQRLNKTWGDQKEKALKEAHVSYKKVQTQLSVVQKNLDKEVQNAVHRIQKSAVGLEKNLEVFRQKAKTQSKNIEKLLFGAKKKAKRKTTRTSKKA